MTQLSNTEDYRVARDGGASLWRELALSHVVIAAALVALAALSAVLPDVATYLAMMG